MTVTILIGDVRDRLAELPDESVNCIVTSPPYYGLRDYGTDPVQWPDGWMGELGQELTLAMYLDHMTMIFASLKRVLRNTGTLWLNIGDSYATNPGNGRGGGHAVEGGVPHMSASNKTGSGLRAKNLMMVPARLALALQDDGWYLRSDIIWHKPNPMPESATDRPTMAHEHIFLMTKQARYWYDADAVRSPLKESSINRLSQDIDAQVGSRRANGGAKSNGPMKAVARTEKQRGHSRRHEGFNDRWDQMSREEQQANGANLRNVWTIATKPFPGAHYATFPPDIPRLCIKAGCPEGRTVLDPFGGSGTTGMVAEELGRNSILIELHPKNVAMADERIRSAAPLLNSVEVRAA